MKKLFTAILFCSLLAPAIAQEKQDRKVGNFTAIEAGGAFNLYIRMGNECAVTVIADKEIIDKITTEVSGNELEIDLDNSWWDNLNNNKLDVYITVTNLTELDISGACNVTFKNTLRGSNLEIEASGACEINGKLDYNTISLEASGASDISLDGTCNKLNIDASGAFTFKGADLQAEFINIDASGASEIEVHATKKLNIDASGACNVVYHGNPQNVYEDISGAASISKR